MMASKETQDKIRKYDLKYKKDNYKVYAFRLNKKTDADLIKRFDNIKGKTEYLKELIEKDLKS